MIGLCKPTRRGISVLPFRDGLSMTPDVRRSTGGDFQACTDCPGPSSSLGSTPPNKQHIVDDGRQWSARVAVRRLTELDWPKKPLFGCVLRSAMG
jgi:hypothetical protein